MRKRINKRWIGLVTLLVSLVTLAGDGHAGLPTVGRTVPEVSGITQTAARARVPNSVATELQTMQRNAGSTLEVMVRPGQRAAIVERRADMSTLLQNIRNREASQTRAMQVMTRENAAVHRVSGSVPQSLQVGRVRLHDGIISVEMEGGVIVRMRFKSTDGYMPTVGQLEQAMARLPGTLAGESSIPSTLVYQSGKFWLGHDGSKVLFWIHPISEGFWSRVQHFAQR